MANTIGLDDRFNVEFMIPQGSYVRMRKHLDENNFVYDEQASVMQKSTMFTVQNVNLKRAATLYQLIKHEERRRNSAG